MEQILSLLHTDIIKFKDIFSILIKLEQDGIINEMSKLFYKVFNSESEFAMEELAQIQIETESKINMNKQFENNLILFKSNFHLISQVLIENTFKVILQEGQNRLKGTKAKTQPGTESLIPPKIEERPTSHINSFLKEQEKIINDNPPVLKFKLDNTRASQRNERKSARNENNRSSQTLKSGLALHKIVGGGGNDALRGSQTARAAYYNEGSVSARNYEEDGHRGSVNSQNKSTSIAAVGDKISPKTSPRGSVNMQDSLKGIKGAVQSEFNHVNSSGGTFEKSKRKFMTINQNGPGPAYYEAEKASAYNSARSSNAVMGKAPNKNWVDLYAKTSSPGPGQLYPSMNYVSK